ncbi:MAG: GNAT family N-acetyltransferase [Alphaproteobacteria bacterium]|nr:GNAT family N-acetyltransferase [Alphaproteobacteria bacterium]
MAGTRPAIAADIEGICSLLHRRMSAEISEDGWRRLMTYPWLADKPDLGAIVEDGGDIVGYLGVIYADRRRRGRDFRTGNLTSWYVEKSYRRSGIGLDLLRMATRHSDVVYTSFTPTERTLPLLRLAGLRPLDGERCVWRRSGQRPRAGLRIIAEPEHIRSSLGREGRRLLADHAGLPVHPFLVRGATGDCLVLLSIHQDAGGGGRLEALYVEAPEVFASVAQDFADAVLPSDQIELAVDRRFLGAGPLDTQPQKIRVPRYYRPAPGVDPADVDILYSEIELLDLKLW